MDLWCCFVVGWCGGDGVVRGAVNFFAVLSAAVRLPLFRLFVFAHQLSLGDRGHKMLAVLQRHKEAQQGCASE